MSFPILLWGTVARLIIPRVTVSTPSLTQETKFCGTNLSSVEGYWLGFCDETSRLDVETLRFAFRACDGRTHLTMVYRWYRWPLGSSTSVAVRKPVIYVFRFARKCSGHRPLPCPISEEPYPMASPPSPLFQIADTSGISDPAPHFASYTASP